MSCRVLAYPAPATTNGTTDPSRRGNRTTSCCKEIREIHAESRGSYGSPRVHAELTARDGHGGEPEAGGPADAPGRHAGPLPRAGAGRNLAQRRPTEDDLVNRQFTAAAPDRLWLTDITEHPTAEGKLYCAAVMDAYSRRIIGWSIDERTSDTELVVDALGMALTRRQPSGESTILHSDHGTQYTSWAFGKRLRDAGLLGSMGTVGDCYDNAMMQCRLIRVLAFGCPHIHR